MSEVDDKEYKELLDLFRENNLTKYGIDRLYGAIIDRKTKSRLEIERLNNGLKDIKWYIEKNKTSFSDLYIPASDVVSILVIIDRLLGSYKE